LLVKQKTFTFMYSGSGVLDIEQPGRQRTCALVNKTTIQGTTAKVTYA